MTSGELGTQRAHLRQGLRLGLLALAAISIAVAVAALLPWTHGFFDDERAEVGFASYLFDIVIDIPFGTVALEELAFRGCILALLLRLVSRRFAVLGASLLFGCSRRCWRTTRSTPRR